MSVKQKVKSFFFDKDLSLVDVLIILVIDGFIDYYQVGDRLQSLF